MAHVKILMQRETTPKMFFFIIAKPVSVSCPLPSTPTLSLSLCPPPPFFPLSPYSFSVSERPLPLPTAPVLSLSLNAPSLSPQPLFFLCL